MNFLSTQPNGSLHFDGVSLLSLVGEHGSPLYVYSASEIISRYQGFQAALQGRRSMICYSVKANSNIGILSLLAQLGSGFDIVSGGELQRVLAAGGRPEAIVFSGVGKTEDEIRQALAAGIHCFNAESESELLRINSVAAEMNLLAPVSLRVNPDVDPQTHPYISTGLKENKFGIDITQALQVYLMAKELKNLKVVGVDCHIGSQLLNTKPFGDALRRLLQLIAELKSNGIHLEHVDIGGGIGVVYKDEKPPSFSDYMHEINQVIGQDFPFTILVEPGRSIVANSGVLVTKIEYLKLTEHKNFAIVDAAMNDLIRPALYQSYHGIVPLRPRQDATKRVYDIVGPVCESADFLGKGFELAVAEGDYLVVKSAGAYGFTMSSNYNSRPRPAEVLVHKGTSQVIRPREKVADLFASEKLCQISLE